MRLAQQLDTPWPVYAVAFSGDGSRLAIGGGHFYGCGGVIVVDIAIGTQRATRLADLDDKDGTVGGLVWSADDRYLLASTWRPGHVGGPILALEVDGLELATRSAQPPPYGIVAFATGLVAHGETAIARMLRRQEDALRVVRWPASLAIERAATVQHLTGNRVVVARGFAVTGDHGLHVGDDLMAPGLLVLELATSRTSLVPATARITAIGITADETLITGSERGDLDLWTGAGTFLARSTRLGTIPQPEALSHARWHFYQPANVVGICALADGWIVAVTAGGMFATVRPGEPLATWPLPVPGTPRNVAAHPDGALVAVGLKRGGFDAPASAVAIVELERPVDPYRFSPT